jgi:parvulin-like peptidyl-prolyl isomerase
MSPAERESPEGKQKLADARANYLKQAIRVKLVVQSALKPPEGMSEDDAKKAAARPNPNLPGDEELEEETNRQFDARRAHFSSLADFQDELKRQHITESTFKSRLREIVREQLIYQRMLRSKQRELQAGINISTPEAEKYWQDHQQDFNAPAQVKLRQIIVSSQDKARKLLARIKTGENFEALAKEESLDEGSKAQGGLVGWVEKGQLEPAALDQAAFSAAQGALVGPVQSKLGWHVLRVEASKPPEERSFEQSKDKVNQVIYRKRLEEKLDAWVDELKQKTYVETAPE